MKYYLSSIDVTIINNFADSYEDKKDKKSRFLLIIENILHN